MVVQRVQSGRFLGRLHEPFLKKVLSVTDCVPVHLAKNVLIPLILRASVSVTDTAIQKKIHGPRTTLITSNGKTEYIIKKVKSFEESSLLIKSVTKQLEFK